MRRFAEPHLLPSRGLPNGEALQRRVQVDGSRNRAVLEVHRRFDVDGRTRTRSRLLRGKRRQATLVDQPQLKPRTVHTAEGVPERVDVNVHAHQRGSGTTVGAGKSERHRCACPLRGSVVKDFDLHLRRSGLRHRRLTRAREVGIVHDPRNRDRQTTHLRGGRRTAQRIGNVEDRRRRRRPSHRSSLIRRHRGQRCRFALHR